MTQGQWYTAPNENDLRTELIITHEKCSYYENYKPHAIAYLNLLFIETKIKTRSTNNFTDLTNH